MRRALVLVLALISFVAARVARAECTEVVPPGATKPTLTEKLPERAKAGDLVTLEVLVRHGAGESATLPADLAKLLTGEVRVSDEAAKAEAPKSAPDPADPTHATTLLKVPFVVLSTALHRKTFTIPKIRVVVLRKGGGDLSVCTAPHEIAVEQPTANAPDPEVRPNPSTLPQRTRDERAEQIATAAIVSAIVAAALVAFIVWLRRRPKEAPPPPPPRPSWEIALEGIRVAQRDLHTGALETKGYYDRISDVVRVHLGATYGFDGLEQTTDEVLSRLKAIPSPMIPLKDVEQLLSECDLVKFANLRPPADEADALADLAASVVRATRGGYALRPYDGREEAT